MKLNRAFIAAAALVVALIGAALAGVVAHATADKPASKTTTIIVKETEYHLALSSRKSVIGPARFVIKNNGYGGAGTTTPATTTEGGAAWG